MPDRRPVAGAHTANSVLRFCLELAAFVTLATWGAWIGSGLLASVGLAVALPFVAGVLWGLFVAPRRKYDAGLPLRLAVELFIFGSAVLALVAMDLPFAAAVLGGLVVISSSLHLVWRQDAEIRASMRLTAASGAVEPDDPRTT